MKNKLKRYLSLFLSLMVLLGCFSISLTAFADDLVVIDSTNFPDPVFRRIVSTRYDSDADGYLSTQERERTLISLSGLVEDGETIETLKGIEFFADSLSILRCGGIGLAELDVSALYNLTSLTCQGNALTQLDVSNNSKLVTLNCADNVLTSLTLGSLSSLQTLHCYVNSLVNIDVSQLVNLVDFRCDQNELTSLDVTNNTLLQEFTCSMNHLTSLDLSKNTSLASVVGPSIGDQTTTAAAAANGVEIVIPFEVDDYTRVTSSSLDKNDLIGYSAGEFVAYSVEDIENGIDYTYSTGLASSVDMEVHIDVTRDFYQVSFYADEDMQELLGRSFVNENGTAYAPSLPAAPQCMAFDRWSQDVTNVTSDMDVYIIWKDAHAYVLTNFENDIATITCANCADSYTVVFSDCINAKTGDSHYCEYLDVVADGYINAKDYAQLIKTF